MRQVGPPSEIARLLAPFVRTLDWAWQRMHWWVGAMAVLYALSGVTIVKSDETALVLRWGRLVGDTRALQEHGPGLMLTFPRPIDEVVRVQVKHVGEVMVRDLTAEYRAPALVPERTQGGDEEEPPVAPTTQSLNPLTEGYALTGDHNIVHVAMVARFRVREPADWAFFGPTSEDVLRVEVTAAMVRSLGEMGVDRVLSDGRKTLIATATRQTQAGLDAAHSGLELSSLELTSLTPPIALADNFAAVQSAFIEAETKKKNAQAFAEGVVPGAAAAADAAVQNAHAAASSELAAARGEASAFKALARQYRANPRVVRERLYRDGVERAISTAMVRWVPPPVGGSYNGFRLSIDRVHAGDPVGPKRPDDR